jgi:hypothetical protein
MARDALMTFRATSVVSAIDRRVASEASCCATRTSLDRVEIKTAIQMDHPAGSGVKQS